MERAYHACSEIFQNAEKPATGTISLEVLSIPTCGAPSLPLKLRESLIMKSDVPTGSN